MNYTNQGRTTIEGVEISMDPYNMSFLSADVVAPLELKPIPEPPSNNGWFWAESTFSKLLFRVKYINAAKLVPSTKDNLRGVVPETMYMIVAVAERPGLT